MLDSKHIEHSISIDEDERTVIYRAHLLVETKVTVTQELFERRPLYAMAEARRNNAAAIFKALYGDLYAEVEAISKLFVEAYNETLNNNGAPFSYKAGSDIERKFDTLLDKLANRS
jgi:hypothetical protein